ncbi:MAG: UvrD-helicase domain-containing protein [Oscillospiraceae bacterium]|nr:UvrD-helicase domain-containing protein [Oscillospiraceae bacterium]
MAQTIPLTMFPKIRRMVIESGFAKLNDMQRQAVLTTEGPLLLLAGAGSGKTTVLINRVANLIRYGRGSDSADLPADVTEEDCAFLAAYLQHPTEEGRERAEALCAMEPCEPWRIIAITFTNKAADELKDRLEKMLGPDARDIWAMTFHSACARILRRDIDRLGYDRSFTIYDTSDSGSLIKRILKEFNLDDKTYNYRAILGEISRSKDAMIGPGDYCAAAAKGSDPRKRNYGRVYEEYEKRMQNANAVDFDDLILLTVRLLEQDTEVREYYQRKFRYVLIDEYQDTNNLQYRLSALLAGGRQNICVVGDDDQSIYKFRGATIENILSFENQYKNARTIRLEQNYRSTGHILAASNAVIANNTGRKGKNLWTDKDYGDMPQLYVAQDERDEAQYVAGKILAGVAAGENFRDHAILYRMNAQSNQMEFACKRNGIPYRVIGGTKFFDRAEVKDMLSYLCVVANPADEMRLARIVNQPPRGIGQTTLDTVARLAAEQGKSTYEILSDCRAFPELSRSAPKLGLFVSLIDDLRALVPTMPLTELYDEILKRTGYITMLEAKLTDENQTRIENVNELKTNIATYLKENPEGDLKGFLDEISLYTDLDNLDRSQDCVSMMTMHSAKGLEFDTVFIIGAEEGVFPGTRSIGEPEEMEEERRLCYVAMTRARKKLFFICARHRMLFGKTVAGRMSRFVEEIPDDHIHKPSEAGFGFGGEADAWDLQPEGPRGGYGSGYRDRDSYGSRSAYGSRSSYGSSRGGYGSGGYGGSRGNGGVRTSYAKPAAKRPAPKPTAEAPKSAAVLYAVGDKVKHKAFGEGTVTVVQLTGNDALLEIEFAGTGKKRLMMNTASKFMEKLS